MLVILPGIEGRAEMSEPFARLARREMEVVQVEYPNDRYLSPDELVEYVEGVLPRDRPIDLLGISFSGPITARLLSRNNRDYRRGIFCTTFIRAPRPYLLSLSHAMPLDPLLELGRRPAILREVFLEHPTSEEARETLYQLSREVPVSLLAARLRAVAEIDDTHLLPSITQPCIGLRARGDRLIPKSAVRPFYAHMREYSLRDIPGPHALLLSRPEEAWDEVRMMNSEL